jgi:hypothetical protein
MSGKIICLNGLAVAVALLGLGVAHAQGPNSLPGRALPLPASDPGSGYGPAPSSNLYTGAYQTDGGGGPWNGVAGPASGGGPTIGESKQSSWMNYPRSPGCCGPVGGDGPIGYELYVRNGIIFPVGGGLFYDALHPGWSIEGGARVLFFDPSLDAAWTIGLSVSNNNFQAANLRGTVHLVNQPIQQGIAPANPLTGSTGPTLYNGDVTVTSLNQTFVSAAFGREWYLIGSGDCRQGAFTWRAGMDLGGRWGTSKVTLNSTIDQNPLTQLGTVPVGANGAPITATGYRGHRDDVIGGAFFSIHSDIEWPCCGCLFQAGVRAEYGYTWSDILPGGNNNDLQSINLLFTLGVRF